MHEKQCNQHGTQLQHVQHTQKQQKQHAHGTANKHVQRQQHKDELATKAALHCQPPQNVLLSCLVCLFHPIMSLLRQHASSSPCHRCPAKGTPRRIGEPVAQPLPGQPPIKRDTELCPTKDYLNETLGLCPTKLCFTFREKESNGCRESRQSNQ